MDDVVEIKGKQTTTTLIIFNFGELFHDGTKIVCLQFEGKSLQ